jgi:PAS domain S-box-containing protein
MTSRSRKSKAELLAENAELHRRLRTVIEGRYESMDTDLGDLFRRVLEILPVGVWIQNAVGKIIIGNEAGKRIWGGAKYVGIEQFGVYKGWWLESGEPIKAEEWAAARAITKGEISIGELIEIECFDGTRKIIRNSALPVRHGKTGEVVAAIIVNEDISDLKRSEEALSRMNRELERRVRERTDELEKLNFQLQQEMEERRKAEQGVRQREEDLNRAQAVARIGSWRLDVRQKRLSWSDETYRIFDIPRGTAPSYEIFLAAVHPEDRDHVDRKWKAALRGEPYDIEYRILAQGQVRWVRERAELTFHEEGFLLGGIGTVQDITERKRTEVALHENDRLKTEFITTAAHEFRTPLTSIQGYAEFLSTREDLTAEQRKEFISYIFENSVELGRIVSDLLDLSRIEIGRALSLHTAPCTIKEIFKKVSPFLQTRATAHRMEISLAGEGTVLMADKGRVGQVLENLIDNAFKYSPEGSLVQVRGEPLADGYQIAVADRGIGMTPEQVARVFDKFYRADTSSSSVEGLGLGMNIARHIVEAHGGRIRVESEPGKGTTVTFTLPKQAPAAPPAFEDR